ncbi:MAG: SCP2 sterol-binding domain-containing protein [Oscillospiraceae bacterium]|nr:SCP2 sterol-binding domain-containing protein [Oscillospiraceae bacterium]
MAATKTARAATKTAKAAVQAEKPVAAELGYDQILDALRAGISRAKAPVDAHVAAQVRLYGKVEGILYILVANGIVVAEPFDYKGADIEVDADSETFMSVLSGNKPISNAIAEGSVKMQGNAGKAIILGSAVFFDK